MLEKTKITKGLKTYILRKTSYIVVKTSLRFIKILKLARVSMSFSKVQISMRYLKTLN